MSRIHRRSGWMPSGPRLWIVILVSVFVLFLSIYESMVSDDSREDEYDALPNNKISLAPIEGTIPEPPKIAIHSIPSMTSSTERIGQGDLLDSAPDTSNGKSSDLIDSSIEEVRKEAPKPSLIEHTIVSGDTLEAIFQKYGIATNTLYNILEADQEYLVLEPLQVGDRLRFEIDEKNELTRLSRRIDPSKTIAYERHDNGGFVYKEELKKINWSHETAHGKVKGSFYLSAKRAGLKDRNIMVISELLKNRFDFRRDLRAGDTFDAVFKQGDVDGELVGGRQLEAVRIKVRGNYYQAFLHNDGRYYDEKAQSLTPALRRWPTLQKYRITSKFNPNRRHPVTGRLSPHNGTDIGTPNGTKIIATGDGIVTRTANHRYAGRYLVIDNIGKYSTRFLHLSKILVRKGQRVKRGQVIALSGSTGRVTGPHLHYELHVNGRPVNPMTARIPTMQSIPKKERSEFEEHVATWDGMMDATDNL
ncbi:peptidoglycan DD-metalloendopeptidase family protein [Marinomonas mediterranea]|uniref:peptidoglycan DD-metalloendopeptidase family protein n=1 Tax=Marinomonas mediterranea TaxID=119864 RepID=UPI00234A76C4|nr:peptidoglycan DD-metalloendopeptidase family protein [Marinomonas mediterranea]